ncbi:MAG: putative SAM-dependent methyltransferase [Fibrobacteres bacterium]|nr:putative SAM-dependent methyltransferase [Fibrobacterota bacterium]
MSISRILPLFVRKGISRAIVSVVPELRAVRKVIRTAEAGERNEFQRCCDDSFQRRLATYPVALRTAYWENHFEWRGVAAWKEMPERILDFGCGSGHSDIMLARAGRTVHGVDGSPIGIAIAKYAADREPASVAEKLSFSLADVTVDGPPCARFDAVWSSHVFEHIADPGPALRGLENWVNPGAVLLVSVPLGHAYEDPGHVNHFPDEEALRAYLEPHIAVIRTAVDRRHRVIRALCGFASS